MATVARTRWSWTKPYFGVQHLLGLHDRFQATIEHHESFTSAWVLDRHSNHPFTPISEGDFPTVAKAQRWIEKRVRQLCD
jgi:hypothetical protein